MLLVVIWAVLVMVSDAAAVTSTKTSNRPQLLAGRVPRYQAMGPPSLQVWVKEAVSVM